jgi:predicted aconitase
VITQSELDELRARRRDPPDLVVFGCPQASLEEASALAERFSGTRARCPTWIFLIPADLERFRKTEAHELARAAGVEFKPWCPLACLSARLGRKRILTPSAKLCYYLRGAEFGTRDDCLEACGAAR